MTKNISSQEMLYEVFNHLLKVIILVIVIGVTIIFIESSYAMGVNDGADDRRFYRYSTREMSAFFRDIGYQEFWSNSIVTLRNSDGSMLRFLNKEKKKIIIAKCDGSVSIIDSPGYQAWLNDVNKPVVWLSSSGNEVTANYANGMSEKRSFSPSSGPDPSGKYFIKEAPEKDCYVTIYSTERPNVPLIEVNLCGVTKLYVKDKKIYLVGDRHETNGTFVSEVRVFKETERLLEQVDSIVVPRPDNSVVGYYMFYAVDFCPWDDKIVFIHPRDFPRRSEYYSFDIKKRQLNKVGKMSIWGGQAFYLQCDILNRVGKQRK